MRTKVDGVLTRIFGRPMTSTQSAGPPPASTVNVPGLVKVLESGFRIDGV